jgi:hypothetical protein
MSSNRNLSLHLVHIALILGATVATLLATELVCLLHCYFGYYSCYFGCYSCYFACYNCYFSCYIATMITTVTTLLATLLLSCYSCYFALLQLLLCLLHRHFGYYSCYFACYFIRTSIGHLLNKWYPKNSVTSITVSKKVEKKLCRCQ